MAATSPYEKICATKPGIDRAILEQVITLAVEIAREGREGRKIGTMFTVYDAAGVLARSRCLILDPLLGHPDEVKHIDDPNLRETVKELAQLDGAFVIDGNGVVVSACRYLNASAEGIDLPLGLGSRHMAGASISRDTRTIAVVVSESAIVRVFDHGELVSEIIPELWMLSRYSLHLAQPYSEKTEEQLTVISKEEG
ncbi:MAG: DNA integrity scanning protein DisA nucleotide-binding domain protein [Thermodesulfobacteriota bacterium]